MASLRELIRRVKDSSPNDPNPTQDGKRAGGSCLAAVNAHHLAIRHPDAPLVTIQTPRPLVQLVEDWVTVSEEGTLLEAVAAGCERAVTLKGRVTQGWGGRVTPEGLADHEPMPQVLQELTRRVEQLGLFPDGHQPNHVLINEYEVDCGIFPHTDGPSYFPLVTVVSLGSDVQFDFQKPKSADTCDRANDQPLFSVWLPRRSLLVFRDDCYTGLLHGIAGRTQDDLSNVAVHGVPAVLKGKEVERGLRTSITIRHVTAKRAG